MDGTRFAAGPRRDSGLPARRPPGPGTLTLHPEFLALRGQRLFSCRYGAAGDVGELVVVHSLFDEMNKARALAARLGRRAEAEGIGVSVLDPFGTGDSAGDLDTATFAGWVDDYLAYLDHLAPGPRSLLAIRGGALLASQLMARPGAGGFERVVLWQPVTSGEQFLSQFLRTRVAASKFAGRDETLADLRAALARGEVVEVAGYPLTRTFTDGLDAARWAPPTPEAVRRLEVFEIGPIPRTTPSAGLAKLCTAAEGAGVTTAWHAVAGERFWAMQELSTDDGIVDATLAVLADHGAGP